jgi:hypothetical protein
MDKRKNKNKKTKKNTGKINPMESGTVVSINTTRTTGASTAKQGVSNAGGHGTEELAQAKQKVKEALQKIRDANAEGQGSEWNE